MEKKHYVALVGGFDGKDGFIRFEANNDDEAFVMATVAVGEGLEEVLLYLNSQSEVTGRALVTRDMGNYFDVNRYNPPVEQADFSDIYITPMTYLFNITDNKKLYAELPDYELEF